MRCQLCHCLLHAIVLVAAYAIPCWATAQNAIEIAATPSGSALPVDSPRLENTERMEHSRIQQERAKAAAVHEATKAQCYQRFLVNDCLLAARDQHNAQLADLRRQEISLNDTQRKRRGVQQAQRIQENAKQLEQTEQRGIARRNAANREPRQADKAAPQAKAPKAARVKVQSVPSGPPAAKNKPKLAAKKAAPKQAKAAPTAQSTAAFDQRMKDAQQHRAEVEARLKKNKNPPAATLPVPPN